jgi:hypothetical protein
MPRYQVEVTEVRVRTYDVVEATPERAQFAAAQMLARGVPSTNPRGDKDHLVTQVHQYLPEPEKVEDVPEAEPLLAHGYVPGWDERCAYTAGPGLPVCGAHRGDHA